MTRIVNDSIGFHIISPVVTTGWLASADDSNTGTHSQCQCVTFQITRRTIDASGSEQHDVETSSGMRAECVAVAGSALCTAVNVHLVLYGANGNDDCC